MAYGYSTNAPAYGYQKPRQQTPVSPYYRAAQMLKNSAGLFGNGLIQGESKADTPFTNLASTGSTTVAPAKAPAYSQQQVAASLAANPNAAGANGSNFSGDFSGDPSLAQTPSASMFDYRTDPILQEINALSTATRQDAETGALSLRKQIANKYGDAQYARNVLHDEATATAAEQNPYSVFAQLKQMYDSGALNFGEAANKDNLFYSGARIKGQQDLANQYQGQLAGAAGNEQDALGQIDANRLAAILGANTADINAQQQATQRAIDAAVAAGYTFKGYDGAGNPILEPPAGGNAGGGGGGGEASGSTQAIGGASNPAVGTSDDPRIYQMLGRKNDPRYQDS